MLHYWPRDQAAMAAGRARPPPLSFLCFCTRIAACVIPDRAATGPSFRTRIAACVIPDRAATGPSFRTRITACCRSLLQAEVVVATTERVFDFRGTGWGAGERAEAIDVSGTATV